MKIYSGVFFDSGLHMTFDYNPIDGPVFPHGIEEGDSAMVEIREVVIQSGFGVLRCEIRIEVPEVSSRVVLDKQFNMKTPLHITLYTAKGVSPVSTGEYLSSKLARGHYVAMPDANRVLYGKWGFFETGDNKNANR